MLKKHEIKKQETVLPGPALLSGNGKERVCSRLLQSSSEEEAIWGSSGLQCSGKLPGPEGGGPCQRDSPQLASGEQLSVDTFCHNLEPKRKKITGTMEGETELNLLLLPRSGLLHPFLLSCGERENIMLN